MPSRASTPRGLIRFRGDHSPRRHRSQHGRAGRRCLQSSAFTWIGQVAVGLVSGEDKVTSGASMDLGGPLISLGVWLRSSA
ncbi:hypothetical protein NL676_033821 [Syzygium grande]|nr:hypothetical protein NL676_033821 [Syzygium grande]